MLPYEPAAPEAASVAPLRFWMYLPQPEGTPLSSRVAVTEEIVGTTLAGTVYVKFFDELPSNPLEE